MAKRGRFEPSSTALVAVRLFKDKNQKVRKVLKNEWYLLNNWYMLKGNELVKNDDEFTSHRHLYGDRGDRYLFYGITKSVIINS